MARSQVPKFGNWESEEDVPYTVYFDNARKGKKGGKMNPNDPQDYLDAESKGQKGPETTRPEHMRHTSREDGDLRKSIDSPLHSDATSQKSVTGSPHHKQGGADMVRTRHEHQPNREEGDLRRPTDSPLRSETANRRTNDSPYHRYGGPSAGDTPKKVARQSMGSDHSIEPSPLHPESQARSGGKGSGVSSPAWERKGLSEGGQGLAPSTPGRSRLRSVTRGDETPDHSPAVPKFGEWDETDPAAADGYSGIFNKVREERHSGAGKVPVMPTETSYTNGQKRIGTDNSKGCFCFPCGRR